MKKRPAYTRFALAELDEYHGATLKRLHSRKVMPHMLFLYVKRVKKWCLFTRDVR